MVMTPISPPSEPCVRFSRTRLSSQWFSFLKDWQAAAWACFNENSPCLAKNALPPFTLPSRAANIRSVQTHDSTHDHRSRMSPACLVLADTFARFSFMFCSFRIHFPAPLRSTPVTAFPHYYEGSDSSTSLALLEVSLLHVHGFPDHSVSNHPRHSGFRFHTLPLSSTSSPFLFERFQLHQLPAGSLVPQAESSSSPTDWPFVFCCFPPHLTVTQLQSTTGRRAYA